MDDDKGPSAASPRVPAPAAPQPLPPNPAKQEQRAAPAPAPALEGRRKLFTVDLRPGETTIVSWRKLLKEAGQGSGSPSRPLPGAEPALPPQAIPSGPGPVKAVENDPKDEVPPSNRFSAVIEKIERLYMGNQSGDEEELDDVPDDDEYDTEDSFIDDTELDEYFQVDNLATKHNGYFVNKGKLEQIEPNALNAAPKKRQRKDLSRTYSERDQHPISGEHASMSNMLTKAVERSTPFVGKKLSSNNQTVYDEHYYNDSKQVRKKFNAFTGSYKRKPTDFTSNLENSAYAKMQNKDVLLQSEEPKDLDKHNPAALQPSDIIHKPRITNEAFEYVYPASQDKGVLPRLEFQSKKMLNGQNQDVAGKVRRKEKYATAEYANMSTSGSVYPMQVLQHPATRVREGAGIRPRGTRLERAIRDLEKIVVGSRPPSLDLQEVDPAYQGIKRRLPQEIKLKLAKVARLSASQGKISEDELIERLMGILGHLVQRKTLKRNMKEMVELGLSAKQEKASRFQQIKKEIDEMIRARISFLKSKATEQQEGSAHDFQGVEALKRRYSMDTVLEDKICDLYDLYVEGMDEDKGPQSRKLYVELAELWPHGYMDNVGIKDAINRSKERKRALHSQQKVRNEERMKRKRLASAMKAEESNQLALARAVQQRQLVDYTQPAVVPFDKPLASASKAGDPPFPPIDPGQHQGPKIADKVREGNVSSVPESGIRNADLKKKMKRKPESDLAEAQANPLKHHSQPIKERHKSHKHADEATASSQHVPTVQISAPPSSDQPS